MQNFSWTAEDNCSNEEQRERENHLKKKCMNIST